MGDENVIEIPLRDVSDDQPIQTKRKSRSRDQAMCAHELIDIDATERIVTCRDCDAYVDPISYLIKWARGYSRHAQWVAWARATMEERKRFMEAEGEIDAQKSDILRRIYLERPPQSAKVARALWDRVAMATGEDPPGIDPRRRCVCTEWGGRYAIDHWIELVTAGKPPTPPTAILGR